MTDQAELQQPPFVDIPGLANFRDIGGWPIEDGKGNVLSTVRKGIFYRGPDTTPVTDEGVLKLRELGVTTDFDLRSKGQIEKAGGYKDLEGIQRVWCPAFPDGEYSPEKAAARYVLYASDGTEVGQNSSPSVYVQFQKFWPVNREFCIVSELFNSIIRYFILTTLRASSKHLPRFSLTAHPHVERCSYT